MENISSEVFLLTTKIYKNKNYAALLGPKKRKPEDKADMEPEGVAIKKQEQTTTKQQLKRKIHVNYLHANIGQPG